MKPPTSPPERVAAFVALLREQAQGRARALTARQLAAHGFNDRECRQLASQANQAGILVVADNAGYFVPSSPDEVDEMIGRLKSQGKQMLDRSYHLEQLKTSYFAREGMLF